MKDLALLLIRIVAGGTLIAHGYTKLFGGKGKAAPEALTRIYGPNFAKAVDEGGPEPFGKWLESMNVPYPQAAAYASGAAEFGGGLALLLGAWTRLAALAVIVNMVMAIRKAHWETGFYGQGGYEFPVQLTAAAAALFLAGPGAISVDGVAGGTKKAGRAVGSGAEAVAGGARQAAGAVGSGAETVAGTARRAARTAGTVVPIP